MNPIYCETCLPGIFYSGIQYTSVMLVLILCMYSTGHVGVPIPNAMVKLVDVEEMKYFTANSEGEVSTSFAHCYYCYFIMDDVIHNEILYTVWVLIFMKFKCFVGFVGSEFYLPIFLLLLICCVKQPILQSNVVLNHQVVYYAVTNEAIQSIVHTTVTFITSVCVAMCPLVTSSYSCDVMLFVFTID